MIRQEAARLVKCLPCQVEACWQQMARHVFLNVTGIIPFAAYGWLVAVDVNGADFGRRQ
jgi:hypothetical protein